MKSLRKGMWVNYAGKTGILAEIGPLPRRGKLPNIPRDMGEFHLINQEDGTTAGAQVVPLRALSQAAWADVPACRREASVGEELVAQLGYLPGE